MDIKLKYKAWVSESHADIASPLTNSDIEVYATEFAEWLVKNLDIQRVSQQSELLKFLNWLDAQYHDKHYPNINEGIVDNYIKNFNCG